MEKGKGSGGSRPKTPKVTAIQAYEGQFFFVKLQTQVASTDEGWALTVLPKEVGLVSIDYEGGGMPGSPITQVFTFLAIESVKSGGNTVEIGFDRFCFYEAHKGSTGKVVFDVEIVPCNVGVGSLKGFVKYNSNIAEFKDLVSENSTSLKYGYPCYTGLKYGYPCEVGGSTWVKYGYPCGVADGAILKYGYPCEADGSTVVKYGYPCLLSDYGIELKYGFPCC